MRLFAALLSGNGPQPGPKGLGQARAQAGLLEGTLRVAHEELAKRDFGKAGDHAVFVAPEFWFSNSWTANDKFYNLDVKRWIVASLARMAQKYPRILLIPGTVLWVKSKKGFEQLSKISARFKAVEQYHEKGFEKLKQMPYASQYSGSFDFFKKAQVNEPNWSHSVSSQISGKLPSTAGPVDFLETEEDILIGQNTAYVCKNKSILKYHKIGNSAETHGYAQNIVFAPGSIAGQFTVGEVQYGLEICMDHWLGILTQSGSAKVDVQIVTSSTTETRDFHFNTKNNGLFVHASNPPLQSGSVYSFGETKILEYTRLRAYPGLSLDLLAAENNEHGSCSPDDLLKASEPQEGADLAGVLPSVKTVHWDRLG